jgi:tryptophanyl-tRNA synthetase
VVDAFTPFRERMAELLADPAELDRILARGAERAATIAEATMSRVRDAVGLLPAAE